MQEPEHIRRMYEELGELFVQRGHALGLGRALTAEEALVDPVCAAYMDLLIDGMLGTERSPS